MKVAITFIALFCIVVVYVFIFHKLTTGSKEGFQNHTHNFHMPIFALSYSDINVYLINMKEKKDRLDHFTAVYRRTDLGKNKDIIRIEAVNGRKINLNEHVSRVGMQDINFVEKNGYRTSHNQLTRGAVGCYLSHINVLRKIRDAPQSYGIVFEDDIKFVYDDIFYKMRVAMAQVPNDWDILFLQCVCHVCKFYEHYKDAKHFFLTHAYIIKKESADKILKEIEFLPIRQQIDSELSSLATAGKLKLYCIRNPLAIQHSAVNATSIQMPMKRIEGINPYALF